VKYVDPDGRWYAFHEQIKRFNTIRGVVAASPSGVDPNTGFSRYPTPPEIQREAERREVLGAPFSNEMYTAARNMRLSTAETESYRNEETARYVAFKELRRNSISQNEFNDVVREAGNEYNRVLGRSNRPEDIKAAEAAANKVIDDFIQSRNPSYNPPNNEEPL
jgi:hypothetical protein